MAVYRITDMGMKVLDQIRSDSSEAARILTSRVPNGYPAGQQIGTGQCRGLAILTAAGSDSSHWQWKCALRSHSTGKFVAGAWGYENAGECVIADAGPGGVAAIGLLFSQAIDDGSGGGTALIFVPLEVARLQVKITGASTISGRYNAWQYSWIEQTPGAAGLWVDRPSGHSSSGSGYGYNSMEANNSASGIQGNGIDLSSLPSGSVLLPIRGNPVLRGELLTDCSGTSFLTFEAVNQTQCGSG